MACIELSGSVWASLGLPRTISQQKKRPTALLRAQEGTSLRLTFSTPTGVCSYFFAALTVAHLALAAALIFARPAAENRRLPALIETTFRPLAFAQRAFCDAEIRARAAALIFRRGLDDPAYVPANATSAAFSPFNWRATLSPSVHLVEKLGAEEFVEGVVAADVFAKGD